MLGTNLSLENAVIWREQQRRAGRTLVMTNGHFDLLHGPRSIPAGRRAVGDALAVGLNSDASTRARKPGRPSSPRRPPSCWRHWPASTWSIFDAPDANALVAALRPEVYVKGGDWGQPGGPQPPEAHVVLGYGGRVVYLAYVPDHSTTRLIHRIRELADG
jgi:bifunctional ADP-heptose synthase (sugar kinase/adenylyltransferase)